MHPTPYTLDSAGEPLSNLYQLARAALAAYGKDAYDACEGLDASFPAYHAIVTEDVKGFAASNDSHVVVAFRGSSEEREWTHGVHFEQIAAGGGHAHKGFSDLVSGIWQQLLAILYDTRASEKHLWLTGHSAGGALAVIAALRLEDLGFEPAMIATFGSPRVLDCAAAESLRVPAYRVENADDPVPHVPWPSAGYVHVGQAVRLMPSGAIAEARHSQRIARRLDRVNELFEGRASSGFRHDHQMLEYARKLSKHR